jgi:hypothetical protein
MPTTPVMEPPVRVELTTARLPMHLNGVPTITQFLFAHTLGRIASIDADIARQRRADRGASGPFHVEDDPGRLAHRHSLTF